jgi:hypothetical protein
MSYPPDVTPLTEGAPWNDRLCSRCRMSSCEPKRHLCEWCIQEDIESIQEDLHRDTEH